MTPFIINTSTLTSHTGDYSIVRLQIHYSNTIHNHDMYDDDDGDDESISYVRTLLQLQTVTSVLMICSNEQFSFQIATE